MKKIKKGNVILKVEEKDLNTYLKDGFKEIKKEEKKQLPPAGKEAKKEEK